MINHKFQFLYFFLLSWSLSAQVQLTGISSQWNDSFSEWKVYASIDSTQEIEGEMHLKWAFKNDWTEWVIDNILDTRVNIKMKYANNSNFWELRSGNTIIMMQTKWSNDFTEWRVKFDGGQVNWKADYKSNLNYWYYDDDKFGFMEMFSVYDNDPRDWEIIEKSTNIPQEVNLACMFLTSFFTSPRQ